MDSLIKPEKLSEQRGASRMAKQFFLKIAVLEEPQNHAISAYTTDISSEGVGVLSFHSFPIGTLVKLIINNKVAGIGEVVNLIDDLGCWERWGIEQMGIKLISKNQNWPVAELIPTRLAS